MGDPNDFVCICFQLQQEYRNNNWWLVQTRSCCLAVWLTLVIELHWTFDVVDGWLASTCMFSILFYDLFSNLWSGANIRLASWLFKTLRANTDVDMPWLFWKECDTCLLLYLTWWCYEHSKQVQSCKYFNILDLSSCGNTKSEARCKPYLWTYVACSQCLVTDVSWNLH